MRFRVRAVVVTKHALDSTHRRLSRQEFTIEFLTRLTLRASDLDIGNDVLVIDGAALAFMRALRIRLCEECRAEKHVRPFRKIVSGDSKRGDGLQLADMIAGRNHGFCVGRRYEFLFNLRQKDCGRVASAVKRQ